MSGKTSVAVSTMREDVTGLPVPYDNATGPAKNSDSVNQSILFVAV